MLVQWFLAAIHLLAFALGFWAVLTRGTAFRRLAAGTGRPGGCCSPITYGAFLR